MYAYSTELFNTNKEKKHICTFSLNSVTNKEVYGTPRDESIFTRFLVSIHKYIIRVKYLSAYKIKQHRLPHETSKIQVIYY